jgi:hypothetical protein
MDGAKCLWENFIGGSFSGKKSKEQTKKEEEEKKSVV